MAKHLLPSGKPYHSLIGDFEDFKPWSIADRTSALGQDPLDLLAISPSDMKDFLDGKYTLVSLSGKKGCWLISVHSEELPTKKIVDDPGGTGG